MNKSNQSHFLDNTRTVWEIADQNRKHLLTVVDYTSKIQISLPISIPTTIQQPKQDNDYYSNMTIKAHLKKSYITLTSINHKHRTHTKSKFNNYPTKKRQKKKWGEFPHLPKCSIFLIINTHFLLKQAREPTAKQEQNKANNNPKFRSNHLMRDHQQSWRTKTELQH